MHVSRSLSVSLLSAALFSLSVFLSPSSSVRTCVSSYRSVCLRFIRRLSAIPRCLSTEECIRHADEIETTATWHKAPVTLLCLLPRSRTNERDESKLQANDLLNPLKLVQCRGALAATTPLWLSSAPAVTCCVIPNIIMRKTSERSKSAKEQRSNQ